MKVIFWAVLVCAVLPKRAIAFESTVRSSQRDDDAVITSQSSDGTEKTIATGPEPLGNASNISVKHASASSNDENEATTIGGNDGDTLTEAYQAIMKPPTESSIRSTYTYETVTPYGIFTEMASLSPSGAKETETIVETQETPTEETQARMEPSTERFREDFMKDASPYSSDANETTTVGGDEEKPTEITQARMNLLEDDDSISNDEVKATDIDPAGMGPAEANQETRSPDTTESFSDRIDHSNGQQKALSNMTLPIPLMTTTEDYSTLPEKQIVTKDFIFIRDINATDRSVSFSWSVEPTHNLSLSYQVNIQAFGPNHDISKCSSKSPENITNTTTFSHYSYSNLLPDYEYFIRVSSILVHELIDGNTTFSTKTAAPGKPRNITRRCEDKLCNRIILNWDMPCDTNGNISHYIIKYEGVHLLDEKKIHMMTNITYEQSFSLTNLLALSKYTLKITAVGTNRMEGEPETINFETPDVIPDAPIVSVVQLNSTAFNVSWKLQRNQLGNITKMKIHITSLGPAYDQNPSCSKNPTGIRDFVIGDSSYIYAGASPYYGYNVSVSAISSRSEGPATVECVRTYSSAPDRPENAKFDIIDATTTANIFWDLPCHINGPINYTRVEILGTYTEDEGIDRNITEFPYISGKWHYEYLNISLDVSFDYIVKITIVLEDGTNGIEANTDGRTKPGIPGKPRVEKISPSYDSFGLKWAPPEERRGKIIRYNVDISGGVPLYYIPQRCRRSYPFHNETIDGSKNSFSFNEASPFHRYDVNVTAWTLTGHGEPSMDSVNTVQSAPNTVENVSHNVTLPKSEDYNASATISFRRPCFSNGPLQRFVLSYTRTKDSRPIGDFQVKEIDQIDDGEYFKFEVKLEPELKYEFNVSVENTHASSGVVKGEFYSPSGVPIFSLPIDYFPITNIGDDDAEIVLEKNHFNNTNGAINYVALIVTTKNTSGGEIEEWDGKQWPTLDDVDFWQITPDRWNPFKDSTTDTFRFPIGNEKTCEAGTDYCNKPLESNKVYYLIVRLFTNNFYRNSRTFEFRTEKLIGAGAIVGIIFGLLLGFTLSGVVFFLWRRGYLQKKIVIYLHRTSVKSESKSTSIPYGKFLQYCVHIDNNPEKLKEQYSSIAASAKEIAQEKTTEIAMLPENRRKNRYTNISPFDETRVKLLIDEDDEIGSDYINASYVKGFSGCTEYIATQGPLETTCRDFWKMVLQENVTIIVMVTQFIENDKIKCHRYFPKNHENMSISDDMEVRCATELNFGTYCMRNLQIRKDNTQVTVTHMQFLDWPDFGVPTGTENMLQFCCQMRERVKIEGGIILVHCSAGVGRTGTLIATDILLQTIEAGRQIDIFNTVLELRKQRILMVQTEKQYIYLHSLLRDYLERSPSPEPITNEDPVYENMDIIEKSEDCNPKWIEQESKF